MGKLEKTHTLKKYKCLKTLHEDYKNTKCFTEGKIYEGYFNHYTKVLTLHKNDNSTRHLVDDRGESDNWLQHFSEILEANEN